MVTSGTKGGGGLHSAQVTSDSAQILLPNNHPMGFSRDSNFVGNPIEMNGYWDYDVKHVSLEIQALEIQVKTDRVNIDKSIVL